LHYLRDTQKADLAHVRSVAYKTASDYLLIDAVTLKHLEVVESIDGGRDLTVLNEIDRTVTAMAGRLLRAWLLRPLVSLDRIRDRLDAVDQTRDVRMIEAAQNVAFFDEARRCGGLNRGA
jgi:DNA mismatch repair protein MutS